jgi:hypothetical protein
MRAGSRSSDLPDAPLSLMLARYSLGVIGHGPRSVLLYLRRQHSGPGLIVLWSNPGSVSGVPPSSRI